MFFNQVYTCTTDCVALQIARALAVFSIDEVVVFDESGKAQSEINTGLNQHLDPNILLARLLQYLECPQYLRKNFFPKHSDLQYAGIACRLSVMTMNNEYGHHTPRGRGGYSHICRCEGYGFQRVYSRIGYRNQRVLV